MVRFVVVVETLLHSFSEDGAKLFCSVATIAENVVLDRFHFWGWFIKEEYKWR